MIGRLRGIVVELHPPLLILDVHGVGFEVLCSRGCLALATLGGEIVVTVFTEVREESIRLFGFVDRAERQVFTLLVSVSGVGSKTALALISSLGTVPLLRLIGAADIAALQKVKGIGKRTAERIVVELKERVSELVPTREAASGNGDGEGAVFSPQNDAVAALQALGFSEKDARKAVRKAQDEINNDKADAGGIIRVALKHL